MTQRFPSVYVSHGSPMVVLENSAAREFMTGYGRQLGVPKAILIASAHFEARRPLLSADAHPEMIYDFGGFPRALFEMQYPAPGSPELAVRAAAMLTAAGLPATPVEGRGYDHGTWTPLKLMYPDANIPVVQLSIQSMLGGDHHVAMGRALAPLRDEGVLVMGSGSITHNLRELMRTRGAVDAPPPPWVVDFDEWVLAKAESGALDDIAHALERAPHGRANHPSPEHYLPLPFAMAAAGEGAKGRRVHSSCQYGVLMMDTYQFD
jgi:4,5-DOPA dioxygenase extradiol